MDPMFSCNDISYQIFLLLPYPASIITLPRLLTIKNIALLGQKTPLLSEIQELYNSIFDTGDKAKRLCVPISKHELNN